MNAFDLSSEDASFYLDGIRTHKLPVSSELLGELIKAESALEYVTSEKVHDEILTLFLVLEGYALGEFIENTSQENAPDSNDMEAYYMNFSYISEETPGMGDLYFSSYDEFHSWLSILYAREGAFSTSLVEFLTAIPETAEEIFISVGFTHVHTSTKEKNLEIDVEASWMQEDEQVDMDEAFQYLCTDVSELAMCLSVFLNEGERITEYLVANSSLLNEHTFEYGFSNWLIIDDDFYAGMNVLDGGRKLSFMMQTYEDLHEEGGKNNIIENIAANPIWREYIQSHISARHIQKLVHLFKNNDFSPFILKLYSESYGEFGTTFTYPCDINDERFKEIFSGLGESIDDFTITLDDITRAGFTNKSILQISGTKDNNNLLTLDIQFIDQSLESIMQQVMLSMEQFYTVLCKLNSQKIVIQEYIHWEY